jgi:putative PIN family toxin of toxin-antitoxin system
VAFSGPKRLVLGDERRIAGGSRRMAVPHHAGSSFSMDDPAWTLWSLQGHSACNIIDDVRVVLDTDVMVAALRSAHGASRRCLLLGLERRITLVVSAPLLVEYEAVLTRPEHLAASGASAEDVGLILDDLAACAAPAWLDFLWRPLLRDADDEMVLETAVNGGADMLATFNLADLGAGAARFGIRALRPADLLRALETS